MSDATQQRPPDMTVASNYMLAEWILKNLGDYEGDLNGGNRDFLAAILQEHWEQAQRSAPSATRVSIDTLRIDPRKPESAMSEGEKRLPELVKVAMCSHDWQPDGGVVRFESHPHGEAPHVHTTCSKCGARAWFLEFQWELVKGRAESATRESIIEECAKVCETLGSVRYEHARGPFELCAKNIRRLANSSSTTAPGK